LAVAREHGLRTIAFPAISCGVYGYPIPDAATIAVGTVAAELETHDDIELAKFVLFTPEIVDAFVHALERQRNGK
jgi:O-acetyl-ADP-ribose deacetylase (regulator of RNase III)